MNRAMNLAWLALALAWTVMACVMDRPVVAALFGAMSGMRLLMALEPRP